MGFTKREKITFDTPPSIDEMIEALQALRETTGGDAILRVTGVIEINLAGPRVAAISADKNPRVIQQG